MRLVILLASAAASAAIAQAAHAESPACRHYVFDRTRCREATEQAAPVQPAAAPAEPAAPPETQPAAPPPVQQQALPTAAEPAPPQEAPAPVEASAPTAPAAPPPVSVQQAAPAPAPLAPQRAAPARAAAAPPTSAPAMQQARIDPHFVPPYACNFAQSLTLGPAVCQARKVAEARRHVGELVASHHCDQAAQAALATGDAAFAGRVREFCVPAKR